MKGKWWYYFFCMCMHNLSTLWSKCLANSEQHGAFKSGKQCVDLISLQIQLLIKKAQCVITSPGADYHQCVQALIHNCSLWTVVKFWTFKQHIWKKHLWNYKPSFFHLTTWVWGSIKVSRGSHTHSYSTTHSIWTLLGIFSGTHSLYLQLHIYFVTKVLPAPATGIFVN